VLRPPATIRQPSGLRVTAGLKEKGLRAEALPLHSAGTCVTPLAEAGAN
jgi:hypothetical protein